MNCPEMSLFKVLMQSGAATAVYNTSELNLAFVNNAMLQIWGRTKCITGRQFGEIFPEFTEQGFTGLLQKVWNTGETYTAADFPADITINGITKTRYFDFVYKPILSKENKTIAIIHTATDVTCRTSAYKKMNEQDASLSFNKELEILTHTLSHDVKNPLSIIKMGAQFLKSKNNLCPAEKDKWITLVLEAVNHVDNIINHTVQLNQARLHGYTNECIDMEETIHAVCNESQLLYNSPECLFNKGTLLPVYGDSGVLYQIFFNVIGNAVKYSSHNRHPVIEIDSRIQSSFISYRIKDNGIGIPDEDIAGLFKVYTRASNTKDYKGTGVGLCLVKKIMHRLKGDILISSKAGYGTTVTLLFPIPSDNTILLRTDMQEKT